MPLDEVKTLLKQDFRLPHRIDYQDRLAGYVRRRRHLLLLERVQYLRTSGWLDELSGPAGAFFSSVERMLGGIIDPQNLNQQGIPQMENLFLDGFKNLRDKAKLWDTEG